MTPAEANIRYPFDKTEFLGIDPPMDGDVRDGFTYTSVGYRWNKTVRQSDGGAACHTICQRKRPDEGYAVALYDVWCPEFPKTWEEAVAFVRDNE